MKVSELKGALLDFWVAKGAWVPSLNINEAVMPQKIYVSIGDAQPELYQPSKD
jgi:hypothetical protein